MRPNENNLRQAKETSWLIILPLFGIIAIATIFHNVILPIELREQRYYYGYSAILLIAYPIIAEMVSKSFRQGGVIPSIVSIGLAILFLIRIL